MKTSGKRLFNSLTYIDADFFFWGGGGLNLKGNAFLNKLHKLPKSQVVLNPNNVNNTNGIFPKPQRKD